MHKVTEERSPVSVATQTRFRGSSSPRRSRNSSTDRRDLAERRMGVIGALRDDERAAPHVGTAA
jgi:hypothetical protein